MIAIPILLGVLCSLWVNGLADNLLREENGPLPFAAAPRCAYCDSTRKAADWSAVASNLFFAGGCLRCGAPRPFRDLLVEAVLWIGIPAVWMTSRSTVHDLLIGAVVLSAFLLFAVVDFEHRAVVVEAVAWTAILFLIDTGIRGTGELMRALAGGLGGFLIFLGLYYLGRVLAAVFKLGRGIEPLGFGDVILATLVGFVVGWPGIVLAATASIVLGGIAGLIILLATWINRKPLKNATMAYGPYLLISGVLIFFYGGALADGIRRLLESI